MILYCFNYYQSKIKYYFIKSFKYFNKYFFKKYIKNDALNYLYNGFSIFTHATDNYFLNDNDKLFYSKYLLLDKIYIDRSNFKIFLHYLLI